MNTFIERVDSLPFSVIQNIQISFPSLIVLYFVIVTFSIWLLCVNKYGLFTGLLCLLALASIRIHATNRINSQQHVIIYNIPSFLAIDFIQGDKYVFKGDGKLIKNSSLSKFHLQPSRLLNNVTEALSLRALRESDFYYQFVEKKIVIVKTSLPKKCPKEKIAVDCLVLSGNAAVTISQLRNVFLSKLIIFDSSNSPWKIRQWIADCKRINLNYYSVPDKGAFVMNLN